MVDSGLIHTDLLIVILPSTLRDNLFFLAVQHPKGAGFKVEKTGAKAVGELISLRGSWISPVSLMKLMNLLNAAAYLVSAILLSSSVDAKTVKVFLLAGQSNMRGMGNPADLKAPYTESPTTVKIWEGQSWIPLIAKGDHFGPEIAFGHAMAKQMPDVEIRLIKSAASGTNLHTHWAPTTGVCYIKFRKVAQTALADLDANKVPYEIAGMLWLQGESDARSPQKMDYEKNLTQFIAHMRETFKTPHMPFLIARVREHYGGKAGAKFVRDAQMKMGETDKQAACFDTDDCELLNVGHYNSAGLIVIGTRFAEAFNNLKK